MLEFQPISLTKKSTPPRQTVPMLTLSVGDSPLANITSPVSSPICRTFAEIPRSGVIALNSSKISDPRHRLLSENI